MNVKANLIRLIGNFSKLVIHFQDIQAEASMLGILALILKPKKKGELGYHISQKSTNFNLISYSITI